MENEVLTDRELAIRLLAEALGVTRPMAEAHFDTQRQRFPSPPVAAIVLTAVPSPPRPRSSPWSSFEHPAAPAAAATELEQTTEEPTTLDEPDPLRLVAAEANRRASQPRRSDVSPETDPEASERRPLAPASDVKRSRDHPTPLRDECPAPSKACSLAAAVPAIAGTHGKSITYTPKGGSPADVHGDGRPE
jgi:hypothetical protein